MNAEKPVLVTGAGGWLASHVIYQLLDEGQRIRGTIRSKSNPKYAFLRAKEFHPRAEELLELVETDLLEENGWTDAVKGCDYVYHIASPFTFKYSDEKKELIEPAIKGTENVLNACINEGVKRVVLTSSVCSVMFGHPPERYRCDVKALTAARQEFNQECHIKGASEACRDKSTAASSREVVIPMKRNCSESPECAAATASKATDESGVPTGGQCGGGVSPGAKQASPDSAPLPMDADSTRGYPPGSSSSTSPARPGNESDANAVVAHAAEAVESSPVESASCCPDPYIDLRTSHVIPTELGGWKLMSEADWSVPGKMKGYELSKTLAEKRAWEIVETHNKAVEEGKAGEAVEEGKAGEAGEGEKAGAKIELVVMCPGFVFGPIFDASQGIGESSEHVLRLLNRVFPFVPPINSPHVDVRDAAQCHVLGMKANVANRRFVVVGDDGNVDFGEQAMLLERAVKKFGFAIPTFIAPKALVKFGRYFSSAALVVSDKLDYQTYCTNAAAHRDLGMKSWRTLEGSLYAHAISLAKFGCVRPKKIPQEVMDHYKPY